MTLHHQIGEKTSVSLVLALSVASALVGGVVALFSVRDAALADIRTSIRQASTAERDERNQALTHYITREEWAQRWGEEGARRDAQFWQLRELILQIRSKR